MNPPIVRSNRLWRLGTAAVVGAAGLLSSGAALADDTDTVFLASGGRVRGKVMEEDPKTGVSIKLLDGTVRTLKPPEVKQVVYAGAAAPVVVAAPVVAPPPVVMAPAAPPPGVLPAMQD